MAPALKLAPQMLPQLIPAGSEVAVSYVPPRHARRILCACARRLKPSRTEQGKSFADRVSYCSLHEQKSCRPDVTTPAGVLAPQHRAAFLCSGKSKMGATSSSDVVATAGQATDRSPE